MFKRFLTATSTATNEREQAKDMSFIDLTITIERMLKRSLTQPELSTVWGLNDIQTEVITNLLKEARNGEERST